MPVAARSLQNLRTTGRPPGFPNKVQQSIKEMVEKALHKAGGVEYLAEQARANPVAFLGLIGKVLPLQLAGADGGALIVDFRWAGDTNVATAMIEHETANTSVDTHTSVDTQPEVIEVEWKDNDPP